MKFALVATLLLAATGCVSTQMKSYVGQDLSELYIAYGQPVGIIDMPDGKKAYQFRFGGGAAIIPGTTTTTVTPVGQGAVATTTGSPAYVVSSDGCILTFIVAQSGERWTVTDYRVPKDLVC